MTLEILPARPEDCETISSLIHALAAYEKLSESCRATPEKIREALFGASPTAHCLLAWESSGGARRPVAFALYFFNFSTFEACKGLYLEDLFVVPEARGSGVGTAMIRHLAGIAQSERCARLEWVVLDWNTSAQAFYKKLGAEILTNWWLCRVSGPGIGRCAGQGSEEGAGPCQSGIPDRS